MCERDIVDVIEGVEFDKVMTGGSPAALKKFSRLAKKLRAIELSDIRYYARQSWIEELKSLRQWLEKVTDKVKPRHGSRRLSTSKQIATVYAYALLVKFGKRPPGLTRGGTWHRLATILYGDERADLFDYLRRFINTSLYNDIRASRTGDVAQPGRVRQTQCRSPTSSADIQIGPLTAMIAGIAPDRF
jgi:hypothetical protein